MCWYPSMPSSKTANYRGNQDHRHANYSHFCVSTGTFLLIGNQRFILTLDLDGSRDSLGTPINDSAANVVGVDFDYRWDEPISRIITEDEASYMWSVRPNILVIQSRCSNKFLCCAVWLVSVSWFHWSIHYCFGRLATTVDFMLENWQTEMVGIDSDHPMLFVWCGLLS